MKQEQGYPILYAAYGANTNKAHMAQRCPTAVYIGNIMVEDFALVFRGVADIVPRKGSKVQCALWRIMPDDERALDRFEGFPHHYSKMLVDLRHKGKTHDCMLYIMTGNRHDRHEPPRSYEETLRAGYADCNMNPAQINAAVKDARGSARRELTYTGKWWQQDRRADRRDDPMDDGSANDSWWMFDSSVRV